MEKEILERMLKLEKRVDELESSAGAFKKAPDTKEQVDEATYKGPKGGITLLMQEGFLNSMRTAKEMSEALEAKEYYYQNAVVQTALNRLSGKNGPLTCRKDGKIKTYVKRK